MGGIDYTELLDGLAGPVVFCDCSHVIRYMNDEAIAKYANRGGADLIGTSIFDCHNETSNDIIRVAFDEFTNGLDEKFLCVSDKTDMDVFMTVVRNEDRELVGYYERYSK